VRPGCGSNYVQRPLHDLLLLASAARRHGRCALGGLQCCFQRVGLAYGCSQDAIGRPAAPEFTTFGAGCKLVARRLFGQTFSNTELNADTPEVTTALLKFMAEFVLNKTQVGHRQNGQGCPAASPAQHCTSPWPAVPPFDSPAPCNIMACALFSAHLQRLTFDSSSPNGILLFREVSKVGCILKRYMLHLAVSQCMCGWHPAVPGGFKGGLILGDCVKLFSQ